MIITTTETLQGKKIESYLGVIGCYSIQGHTIEYPSEAEMREEDDKWFEDMREKRDAELDTSRRVVTADEANGPLTEDIVDCLSGVQNLLEKEAIKVGANAVIGVHIYPYNDSSNLGPYLIAFGTAVKIAEE